MANAFKRMALAAGLLLALPAYAAPLEQEVDYLLDSIRSSDCDFLRNDKRHSPQDAADHLMLKFKRGRRYVKTTEQFIDRLASESSWTGKPYFIECPSERPQLTGEWLHRELRLYRQMH